MFTEQQFATLEPKEYLQDFLNLSEEEKAELKTRIKQWNGLVRIFVHPMFEKWRGIKNHENKKLEKIIDVVAKLSAMESDQTPPIIFMEEASHLEELKKWFEQGIKDEYDVETHNNMYLISTTEGDSEPVTDPSIKDKNKNWENFRALLESLDVKKIIIGGMQLEFEEKSDGQGTEYFRCLGHAYTELSEEGKGDFEVELSYLSDPKNRTDQQKLKDKKPRVA